MSEFLFVRDGSKVKMFDIMESGIIYTEKYKLAGTEDELKKYYTDNNITDGEEDIASFNEKFKVSEKKRQLKYKAKYYREAIEGEDLQATKLPEENIEYAKPYKLLKRIRELADGKVLDVSDLKASGIGAKTINIPKRGKKISNGTAPIYSGKREGYFNFVQIMKLSGNCDMIEKSDEVLAQLSKIA